MIDLRSDTVTRPGKAMRAAMAEAEVGDDVFGEDPTVKKLEEATAGILGKEAALFVPTGVMANQVSIKAHTRSGEEVIVEERAHILLYESGAAPVISGVQLRTLRGEGGMFTADQVRSLLRHEDAHVAPITLVCMENTHNKAGGRVLPIAGMNAIREVSHEAGLAVHVDGARLWNAAVALGVSPMDIASQADSVSVCFSKGLGAPVGSAIAGTREFITRCRRIRKMMGGGMRQVGILAAGALYALEHHIDRLAEDHLAAREFADIVAAGSRLRIDSQSVQTNIVIMDVSETGQTAEAVAAEMERVGVRCTTMDSRSLRAVTHLDVRREDVRKAAELLAKTYPR